MKEEWKILKYRKITQGMYSISTFGRIKNNKTGKILNGCNPENEKGYVRIGLMSKKGVKKYGLHRLVMAVFYKDIPELEVNHKDGDKTNNKFINLEYTTRKENAEHAAKNNLYKKNEDISTSKLTNKEVHNICKYLTEGYKLSEINNIMNLEDRISKSHLSKIKSRKIWTNISMSYIWENKISDKYDSDDLKDIIKSIFIYDMKTKDILGNFTQYDRRKLKDIIKSIRSKRIYKKIISQVMSSTTIES